MPEQIVTVDPAKATELKDKGNKAFNSGDFDLALKYYSDALKCVPNDTNDKAVILKNRAAVYLKLKEENKAVDDTTAALEITPNDPKALYRRCQALEILERFEEAYRDAKLVHSVDPGNKAIQPVLAKLHEIVQERLRQNAQTQNKVSQMFKFAFSIDEPTDKREQAMSNLLVLSRERSGADALIEAGVLQKINQLLPVEKNSEIHLNAIRTVGELCKNDAVRTKKVLRELGVPWFLDILNCRKEEQVNAAQYCMQTILNALSGLANNLDSRPSEKLCEENTKEIDTLLTCIVYSCNSRIISGLARDAIIQLITRNVHYKAINWAERLIEIKGLQRLMEVASELEEYKYESSMEITESTHILTSVCFARIYENMYYDKARERYMESILDFVKGKLITPDIESKVRVTVAIKCLLLGPLDVGNMIIAREGIMEMIIVMANTDEKLQQKVACECIIAAASKKDKIQSIIQQGVGILKNLYASKDDEIRVRALVGLCKLGSSGGTDASIRPFADGSTVKLAEACRKFLLSGNKSNDTRRWAAEGLSYLTLDAEVKEKLVEDKPAIRALIELSKEKSLVSVYGVITTFVNLCNAYDKQEVIPEMVELAKFAKHHIPEEHELDDPDFVAKRINALAKEGLTHALVALSKTESDNSKELICRVFNAMASQQDLRGIIVQQGGVKVLLPMSLRGTDKGMKQAAQAIARIGITMNPEVAFPGQRSLEVVRPLLNLLHPECTALESFEALMALCNLAGMNESTRKRILKEQGVQKVEVYLFEEHLMLRRAATQCLTNLVMSPEVMEMYEGDNDKLKFLFLLCGEEDEETSQAAAGAVAMLTSNSVKCCTKLFEINNWQENFKELLAHPDPGTQYRGAVIMFNVISSSKENATKIVETDLLEILMALTLVKEDGSEKVREFAEKALKVAETMEVIKKPDSTDVINGTNNSSADILNEDNNSDDES